MAVLTSKIDIKKSTFNRKLNFAHQYFSSFRRIIERSYYKIQIFLFIFTDHLLLLGNLDCEKFTVVWEWRQMHKLSWTDLTLKPIWVPQFFWKDEEKDQVMMRWLLTLSKALESFSYVIGWCQIYDGNMTSKYLHVSMRKVTQSEHLIQSIT